MKSQMKCFLIYVLISFVFSNTLNNRKNEANYNVINKNKYMLKQPGIPMMNPGTTIGNSVGPSSMGNNPGSPASPTQGGAAPNTVPSGAGSLIDNGSTMSLKNAVYSDLVINPERFTCPQSEDPRMGRKKEEEEPLLGYYPAMGPIRKPNPYKILNTSEYFHIHYLFDYLDTFFIKKNNQIFLDMLTAEFEKLYLAAKTMPKTDNRFADPYTLDKLIFYFSNGAAGTEPFTDPRLKSPKADNVKVISPGTENKESSMKTLVAFNKNLANKDYADMISPIQILLIIEAWQWGGASGSQDIMEAKKLLDKYDFNGDGALDREELILLSILHNIKNFNQCKDFCYKTIIDQVIDPLFIYLDCDNDGYINAENMWQGLRNIFRQDTKYDMYKCIFPLELNKFYRTNSVNDFILKHSRVADGFLNMDEFRKGILLGYWERQVKENVFYKREEINNKIKRWSDAGAKDLECDEIKSYFPKKSKSNNGALDRARKGN